MGKKIIFSVILVVLITNLFKPILVPEFTHRVTLLLIGFTAYILILQTDLNRMSKLADKQHDLLQQAEIVLKDIATDKRKK